MNKEEKRLRKLKKRKIKAEHAKQNSHIPSFKDRDYEWGRVAIFTLVGVVLGSVVLLNIFK